MNNRPLQMALGARPVAAVRAAGLAAGDSATGQPGSIFGGFDPLAGGATPGASTGTGTGTGTDAGSSLTGGQPNANQNNSNLTGADIASIITTALRGGVTIGAAQINSDRARDIAQTNAATLEAINRIRADIATNPNSAQSAVLQSQLQALTAFAQQRDMFRQQETDWLKYALFGVVGLGVLGGGAYLLLRARKNPVLDAHGRPQGLKGRHYVPAAELRRKRAHRSR